MSETTDTGALPMTEPHWPPSFETGPHPTPLPGPEEECAPEPEGKPEPQVTSTAKPPKPVVVEGQYRFLKWWQLVLVLAAVWIPAAGIGLGLFSWWYSLADKTPAVFVVVVYAVGCILAGVIVAMVGEKPLLAALAIALMSAVFASAAAAAPLYGHHFCQHVSRCVGGIIPY
ncbi:hypothetical protein MTER_35960 [Mycolicibacter terrae]|uniref:Transmembrane protein n=1 Tax=Mycolicibacter terrae TaxID=1788 RepID=A0AAD1I1Y0_9MYCO|nr:hypothetical protein [Mycolicibacter terrae]ORW93683.1 hypothetical protein AWC28_16595 [Mycolicibacter terrae]BBX24185.1 hypothetical protein MTER_35960 [Mycolicibacter terrae]SNV55622.1 transmembrane protein [Mycolicibacter terrae]